MKFMEGLNMSAIILGPILAVQAQAWIEIKRAKKQRQEWVFKTLMATRADRLSAEHVRALNTIDIEFYENKSVKAAWKKYLDHLCDVKDRNEDEMKNWLSVGDDLLTDVLQKIAKFLNYEFDVDSLKRGIYFPRSHGELLDEQIRFRKAVLALLEGNKALNVINSFSEEQVENQKNLYDALMVVLKGNQEILVKTEKDHSA